MGRLIRWRRAREVAPGNSPVRVPFVLHILIMLVVAVGVAGVAGWALWQALGEPPLTPRQPEALTPTNIYSGIKIALTVVGGIGGVIALVVAYRKQRFSEREHVRAEAAAAREDIKLFTERFRTTSEQLGSEKAAVRLAGVYAMASLADDWLSGQQMCIDVLCAYLRMPYRPGDDSVRSLTTSDSDAGRHELQIDDDHQQARHQERQVRHTIIRLIGAHLREGSTISWQDRDFDFSDVVFDGGDLGGATFTGDQVTFRGATFTGGEVNFHGVTFSGAQVDFRGVTFSGAQVDFGDANFGGQVNFRGATFTGGEVSFCHSTFFGGRVDLGSATFSGGQVDFGHATFSGDRIDFVGTTFSGGRVYFRAIFSGGHVDFGHATFSGGRVDFGGATFSGGQVDFSHATFSGSQVNFGHATYSGSRLDFGSASFSDGQVDFGHATFSGGQVTFGHATFSGSQVNFRSAQFSGGMVDLEMTRWRVAPVFDTWPAGPPQGLLLPSSAPLTPSQTASARESAERRGDGH